MIYSDLHPQDNVKGETTVLNQYDIQQILEDDAITDTAIRHLCEGVLTQHEIYGDTHCVPPLEEIVDTLVAKIKDLENSIRTLLPTSGLT